MSDFPDAIYDPRTMVNRPGVSYDASKTKRIYAEDFNLDRDELVAIETFLRGAPEGTLWNGKIVPSVSSNILTVALKTLSGDNPSASDPVCVIIDGTFRVITSALSVSITPGTNWANAGSSELGGQEVDWFVYLGWRVSAGSPDIGIARVPYGLRGADFGSSATDEDVIIASAGFASSDPVSVIGRFACYLSTSATSYLWSVPTFTRANLIQRPIFETRWLTWAPVFSAGGSMTYTSVSVQFAKYKIRFDSLLICLRVFGTTGGSSSTSIYFTIPFASITSQMDGNFNCVRIVDNSSLAGQIYDTGTVKKIGVGKYDNSNWNLGGSKYLIVSGEVPIVAL